MTYEEALARLDELTWRAKKHDSPYIRNMLSRLEVREETMRIAHIAGTNGKGSTAGFLAGILRAAGVRTALFTSPHLIDVRERIRIDGEMIPRETFTRLFLEVEAAAQTEGEEPSYFECLFLIAMRFFCLEGADFAIIEAGMGGRRDATNVIESPEVVILTSIGLDHRQYLGGTIKEIASEKAGIIKEGTDLVYDADNEEASLVIEHRAKEEEARVYPIRADDAEVSYAKSGNLCFSFRGEEYQLAFKALYQVVNAMLAIEAAKITGITDQKVIERGLKHAFWPARMEEVKEGIFLDGGHNPDGIRGLMKSLRFMEDTSGKNAGRILVFAAARDKDWKEMIRLLAGDGRFILVVAATYSSERALSPDEIRKEFERLGKPVSRTAESSEDAVRAAKSLREEHETVVFCGSLYFAGEIRDILMGH